MKTLRESNVDTNTVGWYQSCTFDSFVSSSLTEAQIVYQSTIPSSVVLIFDSSKSSLSLPVVRAFQVRSDYREVLMQDCTSAIDKFNLIFNELPVKVSTSVLDKVFLNQEAKDDKILPFSALSSPSEIIEYSVNLFSSLVECTDDSIAELGRLQYSLRNIVKASQSSRNKKVLYLIGYMY
jgi:translation initiation factor 3 subunit H